MSMEMQVPRIAAGTYKARATGAQLCYTSANREQVAVEFELTSEGWTGERITWFGYFGDKADKAGKTLTQRTFESLMVAGWNGEDWDYFENIGCNEVQLVIEHETYEGHIVAKVRWVNRLGGFTSKAPMAADQRKAFAARMKGNVLAVKRDMQAGATQAAPAAPARPASPSQARPQAYGNRSAPPLDDERGPPVADDEIPF